MESRRSLALSREQGVIHDANPAGFSPRQVSIAFVGNLRHLKMPSAKARSNIILDLPDAAGICSGTAITSDHMTIRVTMECEPCSHGARLAAAPLSNFRTIERFLGVVISGGRLCVGETISVLPAVFQPAPTGFQARCFWAVSQIPQGKIVTSLELLKAVGAGRSYARVLPKWLRQAGALGAPVHRVLNASLEPGSWAPDAHRQLLNDGLADTFQPHETQYQLANALWFGERADGLGRRAQSIMAGAPTLDETALLTR